MASVRPTDMPVFRHNARLWLVCAPALLLLLDFGGDVMLGAAALGLMLTYILDALGQPEASFIAFWITVGAQSLGHAVGAFLVLGLCVRAVGLAVVSACFVLLLGVWGSLQLEWLPAQEPGLARLGERMLFALLPLPCSALATWGAAALYGPECTPWVLAASLGVSYCVLCGNAPSSFAAPAREPTAAAAAGSAWSAARGAAAPVAPACDAEGAAVHAAAWVALPALYYAVLHRPTLLAGAAWPHHRLALATLVAGAALLVAALPAGWGRSAGALRARGAAQVGAMTALVLCAQQALALSPHRAAAIGAEPPYDQLFVCAALAAPVLLVALRRPGAVARELAEPLSALVAAVGSGCACAALALPRVYMLCALAAAFSGVRAAAHVDAPSFALCALAVAGLCYGLLKHTLGFVPHHSFGRGDAALAVGPMATALLLLLLLGAAAVLCTLRLRRGARGASTARAAALVVHAALLARVEMALRADGGGADGGGADGGGGGGGGGGAYPLPFLALSLGCGLLLCERLQCAAAPPPPPTLWWLLLSLHCGRASLVLLDAAEQPYAAFEASERRLLAAATLLAAALSQPLHARLLRRAGRLPGGVGAAGAAARLLFLLFAVGGAQAELVPRALALFAPRPAPATALGATLLLLALGGRQLAAALPPRLGAPAARVAVLVGASGMLVAVLQPPLLLGELLDSLLFTLFHPTASYSYGSTPRLLLWPPYLLLLLALAVLAALLGLLPLGRLPPAAQLLCCALVGAAGALCACGALLPLERSLYLANAAALALAAAFVGAVLWPLRLAPSGRGPAALFAALLALLPLGLTLQARAYGAAPVGAQLAARSLYRAAWLATYAGLCAVCALLLKLRARAAAAPGAPRGPAGSALQARALLQQRRLQAARAGAAWMAPLGNLACAGAVALCQAVSVLYLGGSARGALLLAPLLLLLHPHPPLASLHEGNRYAPCAALGAAALGAAAALEVGARLEHGLVPAARGAALAGCAAPSLALCCKFLWDRRRGSELLMYLLAPLPLVPLLLAWATPPLRDLGAAGLAAALAHVLLATHVKSEGLKYI